MPSKFSAKNAADDKLIVLAYTLKLLTDEQRRAIYDDSRPAGRCGLQRRYRGELPSSVELRPPCPPAACITFEDSPAVRLTGRKFAAKVKPKKRSRRQPLRRIIQSFGSCAPP